MDEQTYDCHFIPQHSRINLYCTAVFRDSHTELASHPGLLKWRERAKNVVTECKDGHDKSVLILQAS